MNRVEFTAKTKDKAFERAKGLCELCAAPLQVGRLHYDHRLPCALGGTNDLANCQVLCTPCHTEKTSKEDVPRIRKADRQRRAHIGAKKEPTRKLEGRGFQTKAPKPEKMKLPPRPIFREI